MTYFHITPEILSEWRDKAELDKSLIYNLVKNHVIASTDYLNWASQEYKMPIVSDSICAQLSTFAPEKNQLPELYWREDYVPLAKWKDYTIVGCIEPLAVESGVIQILASPEVLHQAWTHFNGWSASASDTEEYLSEPHPSESADIPSLPLEQLPPLPLEAEAFVAPLTGLDVSPEGTVPEVATLPPLPMDEIVSPERSQEIFKQLESFPTPSLHEVSELNADLSNDEISFQAESAEDNVSEDSESSENSEEANEQTKEDGAEEAGEEAAFEPLGEPIGLSAEVSSPTLDFSTIFSLDALNSKMAETSVQFPPPPAAEVTLNQSSVAQPSNPDKPVIAIHVDEPALGTAAANVSAVEMPEKKLSVFDQPPTTEATSSVPNPQGHSSPPTAEDVLQRNIHVTKAWSLEELTRIGPVNKIDGALMKTLDVTAIFDDGHSRSRGLTREEMIEAYEDIEVCKDIDQMLAAAFKLMHQHFKHSMFLGFFQNQLLPIRWSSQWPMEQNQIPSAVDMTAPSPFKIAYSTGLPYHGYTISNPISDQFFKFWNRGERPDHLTLYPVKISGKTFGYLLGVQASDLINTRYSLRFMEDLVGRIEKRLNELGVRERAAA